MNDWTTKRKIAIVEADDFQDRWDRNGLNILFYWKTKFPKFKISLFTIPDRTSQEMLDLMALNSQWIELCMHGWNHESNFECYGWDYEKTTRFAERTEKFWSDIDRTTTVTNYQKIFKAPGWTITPGYNGYPANEKNLISKDPQAVYKALQDRDYAIMDRHYNHPARPSEKGIICIDCNPDIIHFHTWDMETGDPNGRNGFQQIEEEHGVPWDRDTEFYFISEAIEKGLFKPCQK